MTLNEAAKKFLIAYFYDGKIRQPEHFDKEILGVDSFDGAMDVLSGNLPAWNKTIFCNALGDLVEEGKIKAWYDNQKGWYYQIDYTKAHIDEVDYPSGMPFHL